MTFSAASRKGDAEDAGDIASDEGVYVPPTENADDGVAARHKDSKLQTRLTPEGLQKRLLNMFFEAQTLEEEQGVNILYLALGFLEWREAKASDVPRFAPLVLLPVELIRDGARDRFKLKMRSEDLLTNFSMQAWLKEQFSVEFPELPDIEELDDIGIYFNQVRAAIGARTGWQVHENEIVLGFFSFAKFLLWRDLDPANWPQPELLTGHDILRKILLRNLTEGDPDIPLIEEDERLDEKFKSHQLIHVTEADSSQAIAIQEALSGKNLVIQGPPGTGKSQTITNLIAAAVEGGKRVLFIAEKMAALEVVHTRLTKAKLSSVCLELHSRKASKIQVLEQIKHGMTSPVPPQWSPRVFEEVDGTAKSLRSYADTLHADGPNGLSAFRLMGKMALLRLAGTPTPDFILPVAVNWTEEIVRAHSWRVTGLADHLRLSGVPAAHVWRGVGIETPDLLSQDRLRPLVSALKSSSAELYRLAKLGAELLNCEPDTPVSCLAIWIAALGHLHAKPPGLDDLIAHEAFIVNATRISSFLDAIDRLAVLAPKIAGFEVVFDSLAPNLVPNNLIEAWSHVSVRPQGIGWFLASADVAVHSDPLKAFVPKLKRLFELKAALNVEVLDAALENDWLDVRKAIASNGKSLFRWFSSEYRVAVKQLRSVLRVQLKTFEERIGVLDRLLELKQLSVIYSANEHLLRYFGVLWQQDKTEWEALAVALRWVSQAKLYEPRLMLRRAELFELIDLSAHWPSERGMQEQLAADLVEARELRERIKNDELSISILGGYWSWQTVDTKSIRRALAWTVVAAGFEPTLRLRALGVLSASSRAGESEELLRKAVAITRESFSVFATATKLAVDEALDKRGFDDLTPGLINVLAEQYETEFERITEWPPVRDDLNWLRKIGCGDLADRAYDGRLEARHIEGTLLILAHEAMWQHTKSEVPNLERTHGDELNATVQRFRIADVDRIKMAADQVARAHADQRPSGSAGAVGILKDETKKARKLKPVRRLVEEAGEAIQRFKPVFLMSPLSVAQYLPPGQIQFDLCVIDEASQVRPEDALGAVARCKQLVVVGDDKQLPPTNFFSRMVADEDIEEQDSTSEEVRAAAVKDVESILNLCSRFPERMLRWHYRSEHPALIATSNRNFYKNQLMLPPSVVTHSGDADIGLQFVQVRKGGYERGKTATNEVEADEVAKAVLDHARRNPTKSLGIGTFSVAQRDCVRDRLEHWAAKHPELDEFMRGNANLDPLFVKNLENIQGDERDVIFISVGYGHDQDGRLTQQFGPIGRDGGERRLNVLITRARQRCVVFSSIVAEDIKTEGAPKPGIAAFREFLKLAKDGFKDLAEATSRGFDSDFEESVAIAIKELGYEVHPQVGMAGFFVDLGVLDPRDDKKYLLGVECDGAAYHSSRYARDRDRLRQSILESRGWKIHRVWSTDWFYRQDREVSKLKAVLEAALTSKPQAVTAEQPKEQLPVAPEVSPHDLFSVEEVEGSLLPPYQFAQIKWSGGADVAPHELQLGRLTELVSRIVATEQPIHSEEVGRRLAAVFDLQRAGNRIQEAALKGLKEAARSKYLVGKKGFWRLADAVLVQARDRSQLPAAATVRRADLICPTEIAQAARVVLTASLALEREELVTETARALGFSRTGPDVSLAIGKAIVAELGGELQTDHMGRVRLGGP